MNPAMLTMQAANRGRIAKQLYEQHGSHTEVGKILGVSVTRVRQLIERTDRYALRPSWMEGLDTRLANALVDEGLINAEQVRAALERTGHIPYIGPTRRETLRAWLAEKEELKLKES